MDDKSWKDQAWKSLYLEQRASRGGTYYRGTGACLAESLAPALYNNRADYDVQKEKKVHLKGQKACSVDAIRWAFKFN